MQRTSDGRIRYLLAYQDAPWREDDEVVVESPRDFGDLIDIGYGDEGSRGTWKVGDVGTRPGEPDTLVMWKPPVRGD